MAAPADVSLEDLNGTWILDKSLSSDTNPLLVLQGVNWIIRKAIAVTTVTLNIVENYEIDPTTSKSVLRIDIMQSTPSGLPGTTEKRILDWSENQQEDHIFGKCIAQTRLILGVRQADGTVLPNINIQTPVEDESIPRFLRGEILDGNRGCEGFLVEESKYNDTDTREGLWVQLFIRNLVAGWTVEQVWGFELIDNERRFVRRVVVANKKGNYHIARLVYKFVTR